MSIFSLYWGGALVALPLYFRVVGVGNLRFSKDTFFLAMVFISLIAFGFEKKVQSKALKFGLLYLAVDLYFRQKNPAPFGSAFSQWIMISAGMVLICQMVSNFTPRDERVLLNSLAVACVLQSVWMILNYFGIDPYAYLIHSNGETIVKTIRGKPALPGQATLVMGSLLQPTLSGALVAISTPTLLRGKWIFLAPLPFVACILSGSAMTAVTFLFAIISVFLLKVYEESEVWQWLLGIGALIGFGAWGLIEESTFLDPQGRFKVWGAIFHWMEGWDWVFGKGAGVFADTFDAFLPMVPKWTKAHNEYLEFFVAFGAVGVFVAGLIFSPLLSVAKKSPYFFAVLVGLAVNSFGSFPLQMSATALVGIVAFSFLITQKEATDGPNI